MTAEGGDQKKEKKAPKEGIVIPPKKPKLSKAERRALQEAQRAAKGLKANGQSKSEEKQSSDKDNQNHLTSKQETLNEKKIVTEKISSSDFDFIISDVEIGNSVENKFYAEDWSFLA